MRFMKIRKGPGYAAIIYRCMPNLRGLLNLMDM